MYPLGSQSSEHESDRNSQRAIISFQRTRRCWIVGPEHCCWRHGRPSFSPGPAAVLAPNVSLGLQRYLPPPPHLSPWRPSTLFPRAAASESLSLPASTLEARSHQDPDPVSEPARETSDGVPGIGRVQEEEGSGVAAIPSLPLPLPLLPPLSVVLPPPLIRVLQPHLSLKAPLLDSSSRA